MANHVHPIKTAIASGLVSGILDITGAILLYTFILKITSAQKLLQTIAAPVLGKDVTHSGGWISALAGLGIHFLIAFIFAVAFSLIYTFWKKWFRNPWVGGIVYGIIVWCIMNFVVMPTATGNPFVFSFEYFLYGIGLIIFLVGVPISVITHKMQQSTT